MIKKVLPVTILALCTVLLISVLLPMMTWAAPKTQTREATVVDVPVWNVGDGWHVVEYVAQDASNYQQMDRWFNVTGVTTEGQWEVYSLSFEGGFILYQSGSLGSTTLRSTSYTGTYFMRTSDLALVKVTESATGTYDEAPGYTWTLTESFTHDPPEEVYDFPLGSTSESWSIETYGNGTQSFNDGIIGTQNTPINKHYKINYDCDGIVQQVVPAGTFDCLHVHGIIQSGGTDDRYYNSTVGWDVYRLVQGFGAIQTGWTKMKEYARAGSDAAVSIALEPDMCEYGESFIVNGTAVASTGGAPVVGASVDVEIPNSGVTKKTVTTDSQGKFTATFDAPTINDRTPCTEDKGSWGVLAKVTGATAGWGAATLTLYTPPKPDFNITDADAGYDAAGVDPYAGMEISLFAEVTNLGEIAANNVNVSFYDGPTFIDSVIISSLDLSTPENVSVDWTPQTDGLHNIQVRVNEAQLITELRYDNNEANFAVDVGLAYDANITAPLLEKTLPRGVSYDFTFDIANHGGAPDTLTLNMTDASEEWSPVFSGDTFPLNAGASTAVTLNITAPAMALADDTGTFVIEVSSVGDPASTDEITLKGIAATDRSVELWSVVTETTVTPGDQYIYDVQINNTGNTAETFDLSYPAPVSGWYVQLQSPSINVPAFSSENFTVTVTSPTEGIPGAFQLVPLTATSNVNNQVTTTLELRTILGRTIDLDLDVTPSDKEVDPGDEVTFIVNVGNDGNSNEKILLTYSWDKAVPDDLVVDVDDEFTVNDGTDKDVELDIEFPDDMPAGDYELTIRIDTEAGDFNATTTVDIEVNKIPGLELTTDDAKTYTVDTSDVTNVTLKLAYLGNFNDSVIISEEPSGLGITFNTTIGTMAPGQDIEFTATINAPATAGVYYANITATSGEDSAVTSTVSLMFTVQSTGGGGGGGGGGGAGGTGGNGTDGGQTNGDTNDAFGGMLVPIILILALILFVLAVIIIVVVIIMRTGKKGDELPPVTIIEPAPNAVEEAPAEEPVAAEPEQEVGEVDQVEEEAPEEIEAEAEPTEQLPEEEPVEALPEHEEPGVEEPDLPEDLAESDLFDEPEK